MMQNNTTTKPMENKQTAMRQLLNQLREERDTLPMDVEWNRCFQAIESVIESKYIPIEKEQIVNAVDGFPLANRHLNGDQYYNETYNK